MEILKGLATTIDKTIKDKPYYMPIQYRYGVSTIRFMVRTYIFMFMLNEKIIIVKSYKPVSVSKNDNIVVAVQGNNDAGFKALAYRNNTTNEMWEAGYKMYLLSSIIFPVMFFVFSMIITYSSIFYRSLPYFNSTFTLIGIIIAVFVKGVVAFILRRNQRFLVSLTRV